MKVQVAFSQGAGTAHEWPVEVPAGATAIDAVRASGIAERFPAIDVDAATLGIWGRACRRDATLQEGDRVELYRPLAMDPNEARRLRAKQTRERRRG